MEGERRAQPSWVGGGSIAIKRSRFGELNALFAIAAVIVVYVLTFYLPLAFSGNEDHITCNDNAPAGFCYADPVPSIDTGTASLWAFIGVGIVMIVGSYVLRRGFLIVAPAEIVIMLVMTLTTLPKLSHAEHRQDLLRACRYGVHGSCPGIENLTTTS